MNVPNNTKTFACDKSFYCLYGFKLNVVVCLNV